MHYYTFNIGDFRRQTVHLTMTEECIYRRLLDTYYLTEKPLPNDTKWLEKKHGVKTKKEKEAMSFILQEFFDLKKNKFGSEFLNNACEKNIFSFLKNSKKGKKAAETRWEAKNEEDTPPQMVMPKHDSSIAKPMLKHDSSNAKPMPASNHKPITINQEGCLSSQPVKSLLADGSNRVDVLCWNLSEDGLKSIQSSEKANRLVPEINTHLEKFKIFFSDKKPRQSKLWDMAFKQWLEKEKGVKVRNNKDFGEMF